MGRGLLSLYFFGGELVLYKDYYCLLSISIIKNKKTQSDIFWGGLHRPKWVFLLSDTNLTQDKRRNYGA